MQRKICITLVLTIIIVSVFQFVVLANDINLLNNNTFFTDTSFTISADGTANLYVCCEGYTNVTTGATINITIKKRTLLLFWSEVVSDSITVSGDYYSNEFYYQLEDKGTYKCNVEYIVSGTGGADDVIPFEDTAVYE